MKYFFFMDIWSSYATLYTFTPKSLFLRSRYEDGEAVIIDNVS